jgi:ABC-type uncharacterized transport system substrate-binding protein
MRIGIVGGLDRSEPLFARMAEAAGHEALFHHGATSASGVRALTSLVENSDLVIVLTDVNSHGAVRIARQLLRERGRSPVLLRSCGSARFGALLAALGAREELGSAAAS